MTYIMTIVLTAIAQNDHPMLWNPFFSYDGEGMTCISLPLIELL